MADVLLGVPNSSYIIFSNITGYGYNFTHNVDKKDIRTKGGSLFTYITATGNFSRFSLPTTFVSSSDVSIINSWFSTATDLRFIESDDFPNSYYTVRVTGKVQPYTSFNNPYFRQYYKGSVVIETV